MNIEQLIFELNKVEDKTQTVVLSVNGQSAELNNLEEDLGCIYLSDEG
jgi:cobyric acid synthase